MSEKSIGKNMMIIESSFRNVKSFSMLPVSQDCPYVEAMYDPSSSIMAVISKVKKQSMHMLPRLNQNGEPEKLKFPNKETGKTVKEQRVMLETFSEFYLTSKEDIENFINIFAINSESFDYKQFFIDVKETKTSKIITEV